MKEVESLLELQDKDLRIANLQRMIDSIPEEKAKIRDELQGAESALENAKETLQTIQIKIKDLESDVDGINAKITDLNIKSNDVKKNDEYKAILAQIDNYKADISTCEDSELALLEEVEDAKDAQTIAEKNKQHADSRIKAAEQDLDVRETNCLSQIEKFKQDRSGATEGINDDLIRLYERLIVKPTVTGHFRRGVAKIENNLCGFCHLTIPPDLNVKAMSATGAICGCCGTIIFTD
ncbi:MAG: hypothetical protein HRT89_06465 [Lentisphaeria bacterium]|nr:hypothetical protein [Lentisphaeria bacterium]NQZ67696.1 hypothetical protein [Lentisphaeria bacterium]